MDCRTRIMNDALKKLISISDAPICRQEVVAPDGWGGLKRELVEMLSLRNGFYAFGASLLVRPLGDGSCPFPVERWNGADLWRDCYKLDLPDLYFFAEDVFGGQFALTEDEVVSFDPETGAIESMGNSLEDWARSILADHDYFTGHSLATAWQRENGVLPAGHRLVPKRLFVLGGEFAVDNLMCIDEVRGMRSRGFFATELKDVPDGAQVSFRLVD